MPNTSTGSQRGAALATRWAAMSDLLSVAPFQRSLDYHSNRHNVLASNIANGNTPGFRPKELLRVEASEFRGLLPLVRTEQEHFRTAGLGDVHDLTVTPDESSVGGLDGNNVAWSARCPSSKPMTFGTKVPQNSSRVTWRCCATQPTTAETEADKR
jgi:flagellar basal body rod protein FlgB